MFDQKIGYIATFKIVHLNAVITLSNNKQNKYSNSIYKIYLKPRHDHCFLPRTFRIIRKLITTWPSFVYFKRISVLSISEYFSISVFPKFVVNLPITFAVCKFARTSQIWRWSKNNNKYGDKFVPLSGSTSLQCNSAMHACL